MSLLILLIVIAGTVNMTVNAQVGPARIAIAAVLSVAICAVLMRFDIERAMRSLDKARAGLPVVTGAVAWSLMGDTPGTIKFDEIAAQVIVVLLLALAVDARFFRLQDDRDRIDTAAICFTLFVLAAGEFYALRGLLTEHPLHAEVAAGAVAAGFTAVAISALAGPNRERDSKQRPGS